MGFFLFFLFQSPGKISADTKLDLTANPQGFLHKAGHLWNSLLSFGQVQNQAYGYFFPQGAFYVCMDYLSVPMWVAQRLWWSLLFVAGYIGCYKLAQALGIGSSLSRSLGALSYVITPRALGTIGAISSETLPFMVAPWIAVGVVQALNSPSNATTERKPLWLLALSSNVAIVCCGAVNAVATLAAIACSVLWLLMHKPDRDWKIFTSWWLSFMLLFSIWWIIPLFILGTISPPFLDYIESSRVTTKWSSLIEILRGTSNWSPFVSDIRFLAHSYVTNWALGIATVGITAIGLCGLTLRSMPHHRKIVGIFLSGVAVYAVSFGVVSHHITMGSIIADQMRDFLDGMGKAFRNIHKAEPLLRIPLALGVVHACEQLFLRIYRTSSFAENVNAVQGTLSSSNPSFPVSQRTGTYGTKRAASFLRALREHLTSSHPSPAAGGVLAVLFSLLLMVFPVLTGSVATSRSFTSIPSYWKETAQWLEQHGGDRRTLIVPGASTAYQLWGYTSDMPMQPYARTPWAVRDAIPLVPPEAIRWLDGVENALESGYATPGLAQELAAAGFGYVVVAGDYDRHKSKTVSSFLVRQTLDTSPDFQEEISFGEVPYPAIDKGIVLSDGLDGRFNTKMPAVSIYSIQSHHNTPLTQLSVIPTSQIVHVYGSADSLLMMRRFFHTGNRSGEARKNIPDNQLGTSPAVDPTASALPPVVLTGEKHNTNILHWPSVVTDTPALRETNYGRVYDNHSAIRSYHDPHRITNSVPDYISDAPKTHGTWHGAMVRVSSSAADANELGEVLPNTSAARMFDHNNHTRWLTRDLTSAVGQWIDITFPEPRELLAQLTTAKTLGSQVSTVQVETDSGVQITTGITPGNPLPLAVPPGKTRHVRIMAADTTDHSMGVQFSVAQLEFSDAQTGRAIPISYTIDLPELPAHTPVTDWYLGQHYLGHAACVHAPHNGTLCSEEIQAELGEVETFQRTLSVPQNMHVAPTIIVQSRNSTELNNLLTLRGIHVSAPGQTSDPQGSPLALIDADPSTVWTGKPVENDDHPYSVNTITLTLDSPQVVSAIHFDAPRGNTPATIDTVAVNSGTGRIIRTINSAGWISIPAATTDHITITPVHWQQKISINDLGFATPLAPGFAGITLANDHGVVPPVLPRRSGVSPQQHHQAVQSQTHSNNISPTDPAQDIIDTGCAHGPVLSLNGQQRHFRIRATRQQWTHHDPIVATACNSTPLSLAQGAQSLRIEPPPELSLIAVRLHNRDLPPNFYRDTRNNATALAATHWTEHDRVVPITASSSSRIVYLPQSYNRGWAALLEGQALRPIAINGWQQGWVVPPYLAGDIHMIYPWDTTYRSALWTGLVLSLALLSLTIVWWRQKIGKLIPLWCGKYLQPRKQEPRDWKISRWWYYVLFVLTGALTFAGLGLIVSMMVVTTCVVGEIVRARVLKHKKHPHKPSLWDFIDIEGRKKYHIWLPHLSVISFLLAGVIVIRSPWHSLWGYQGFNPLAQFLCCVSLCGVILSILPERDTVASSPSRSQP